MRHHGPSPRVATSPTLLVALLLAAAGAAHGAVVFDPAAWNSLTVYKATSVPSTLLFTHDGAPPLFPLDHGYDVTTTCSSPNHPFASAQERRAAGACEYTPKGPNTYDFWQRLPGDRQRLANCYCYALDAAPGGWCYPGLGGGAGDLSQTGMTCADLSRRVEADGGRRVARDAAVSGPVPAEGHYIALMLRPMGSCDFLGCAEDFHLMRRDASGRWSHKVGDGPATDRDSDGRQITDPEAAHVDGGYSQLCGYFLVVPGRVKAGWRKTPDRITNMLQHWRDAGITYHQQRVPYDPSTDFVDEAARSKERAQLQRGGGPQQQQQQQQQGARNAQMLQQAPPAPRNSAQAARPAGKGGRRLLRGGAAAA